MAADLHLGHSSSSSTSSSAERCSPCSFPGAAERPGGAQPLSDPLPEMEALRRVVSERLTAVVEDILTVVGRTVARYREHIDMQQRQLDTLKAEEGAWRAAADVGPPPSWAATCTEDQKEQHWISQDQRDCLEEAGHVDGAWASACHIKIEAVAENDHVASEAMVALTVQQASKESDPGDSGGFWGDAPRPWKTEEPEDQIADVSQQIQAPPPLTSAAPLAASMPSCRVCGKAFQRRNRLLAHVVAHPYDCGLCGKHLDDGEPLKLHLHVHREKGFGCGVCGRRFTLRGNLTSHLRIHSGERPHACDVCGKSFGRRATLLRHLRSHTGERPYTCDVCGRGFVEKGNLTVHMRTHTGERPYRCRVCGRSFTQMSCLQKHPCHNV